MLILTNRRNKQTTFKNYEKLYGHIAFNERIKQLPNPPKTLKRWSFSCHSFERAFAIYQYVSQCLLEGKEYDVLEICCGSSSPPQLIPVTPDVNVAVAKEEWLHKYCAAHGYDLTKITDT